MARMSCGVCFEFSLLLLRAPPLFLRLFGCCQAVDVRFLLSLHPEHSLESGVFCFSAVVLRWFGQGLFCVCFSPVFFLAVLCVVVLVPWGCSPFSNKVVQIWN